jgi:hypothetical protein
VGSILMVLQLDQLSCFWTVFSNLVVELYLTTRLLSLVH